MVDDSKSDYFEFVGDSDAEEARFRKFEEMLKNVDPELDFSNPKVNEIWEKMIDTTWAENPDIADCSKPTLADFITLLRFMEEKYCHPLVGYTPGISFPGKRGDRSAVGPLSKPDFTGPGGTSISFEDLGNAFRQGMNALNQAKATVDATRDFINNNINPNARGGTRGVDGGDGGTTTDNYSGGSRFNPTGLSLAAKPVDVKLDTGIGVTNFPRFYKDGKDETAPLIIKHINLLFPNSAVEFYCDEYIRDYFKGPIVKDILANIVSRARYNNAIKETVTYERLSALYNTLSFALAAQCFVDNIIAYQDNIDNRNRGMEMLYNALSPADFLELRTLRQDLQKCFIPPTLYEYIHGLFAPYKQSHLPGSPLMLLCPWKFKTVDTLPFKELDDTAGSMIQQARQSLDKQFILDWNGLLAQTNTTWRNPSIRGYTGEPYIDPNYTTMFTNLQYRASREDGPPGTYVNVNVPSITNLTTPWNFNFHTDAPDGGLLALCSVTRNDLAPTALGYNGPGLGVPEVYTFQDDGSPHSNFPIWNEYSHLSGTSGDRRNSSCVVYLSKGSAGLTTTTQEGFYPAEFATRVMALTGNTYAVNSGAAQPHAFQKFGTTPAVNTYITGFRYTVEQFLEWLCYKDFADGGRSTSGFMTPRPQSGAKRSNRRTKGKGKTMTDMSMEKDET